jgi:hypothetical protein
MEELNKEAHKFLIQKGTTSIKDQYSAYQVQKFLVEFANKMIKQKKN